jgi:hypothetical protein
MSDSGGVYLVAPAPSAIEGESVPDSALGEPLPAVA